MAEETKKPSDTELKPVLPPAAPQPTPLTSKQLERIQSGTQPW